ncbi:MAG: hypothetical protein IJC43_06680, partial [Clostridia bacterium]|nr:hypothetical protein [Clostridia bacterium]
MKKHIPGIVLALTLLLTLLPTAMATPAPVQSSNINDQDYTVYSAPVKSHLYVNEEGGLTRVEYVDGQVVIEDYDREYTLLRSRTLAVELPLWGGFYAAQDYHFLVFGQ